MSDDLPQPGPVTEVSPFVMWKNAGAAGNAAAPGDSNIQQYNGRLGSVGQRDQRHQDVRIPPNGRNPLLKEEPPQSERAEGSSF